MPGDEHCRLANEFHAALNSLRPAQVEATAENHADYKESLHSHLCFIGAMAFSL